MSEKTYASFFTGGALADIGAKMAGFTPIWGSEIDPRIAEIATANGAQNIVVGDVLDLDLRKLDRPNWFHASPECQRASVANRNRGETALDIAFAKKIAEAIRYFLPQYVTIENVYGYLGFESCMTSILSTFNENGYFYDLSKLCAADFSVPQTRRRLVIRAVRGGLVPNLPEPTPWIGWYSAIEDIIDTLPESFFPDWQLARLPEFINDNFITRPAKGNPKTERGAGYYNSSFPAPTVMAENTYARAFLVNSQTSSSLSGLQISQSFQPSPTVTATETQNQCRAFLLSGCGISDTQRIAFSEDEPCPTITASETRRPTRAFLVDGQSSKSSSGLQVLQATDPAQTVTATATKHPSRAWLSHGHVVKMTIKAMGRFQTLPDWYEGATMRIVGNAVPCKLMQAIGEAWL